MANNKACKTCKWSTKKWTQPDNTKANCKELGYRRVCDEWTPKVAEKLSGLLTPDAEDLFTDVLVNHGFEWQLGLDNAVRKVKQACADNGFDVDVDEKTFEVIGKKLIGLRQIRALIMGLGLARYEEPIMEKFIEKLFGQQQGQQK